MSGALTTNRKFKDTERFLNGGAGTAPRYLWVTSGDRNGCDPLKARVEGSHTSLKRFRRLREVESGNGFFQGCLVLRKEALPQDERDRPDVECGIVSLSNNRARDEVRQFLIPLLELS